MIDAVRADEDVVAAMGADFPGPFADLLGRVEPLPVDRALAGAPVEAVVHDGHAPGHTAYWWPVQRLLVAGDMLSDVELALPLWPDDLPSYLAGLDLLARHS